jgi:hypothetical protein
MLKPHFAVSNGPAVNTFECGTSKWVPGDEPQWNQLPLKRSWVSQSVFGITTRLSPPIARMDDIFDVDATDRNPGDESLETKAVRDG